MLRNTALLLFILSICSVTSSKKNLLIKAIDNQTVNNQEANVKRELTKAEDKLANDLSTDVKDMKKQERDLGKSADSLEKGSKKDQKKEEKKVCKDLLKQEGDIAKTADDLIEHSKILHKMAEVLKVKADNFKEEKKDDLAQKFAELSQTIHDVASNQRKSGEFMSKAAHGSGRASELFKEVNGH